MADRNGRTVDEVEDPAPVSMAAPPTNRCDGCGRYHGGVGITIDCLRRALESARGSLRQEREAHDLTRRELSLVSVESVNKGPVVSVIGIDRAKK